MGFAGRKFTWLNKQVRLIKERLDRAVSNLDWLQIFPECFVMNLEITESDHAPILICGKRHEERGHRPFRFLEAWTFAKESAKVVEEAWSGFAEGRTEAWSISGKLSSTERSKVVEQK